MANHSGGRGRQIRATAAKQSGTPAFTEPEVRRWPHPVDGSEVPPASNRQAARSMAPGQIDTALYYIHCALSYQNQLLADIKSLLEQLTVEQTPSDGEKIAALPLFFSCVFLGRAI